MIIKWDCPPTNKELVNNFINNYLDNNEIIKIKVRYSDIICDINNIINKYENKRCVFYNGRKLRENDIKKLNILNRSLYRNMRIQYLEKIVNEIVAV